MSNWHFFDRYIYLSTECIVISRFYTRYNIFKNILRSTCVHVNNYFTNKKEFGNFCVLHVQIFVLKDWSPSFFEISKNSFLNIFITDCFRANENRQLWLWITFDKAIGLYPMLQHVKYRNQILKNSRHECIFHIASNLFNNYNTNTVFLKRFKFNIL